MRTALLFLAFFVAVVASAQPVDIHEWPVPWPDTRPRDPAVDVDGRVWFVGQTGDYVGRLDPKTGKFDRFELEAGAGPHNVIVGSDRRLWFSAERGGYVGRLDPKDGMVVKHAMPEADARDPHTLVLGPGGVIWFTLQSSSYVGRLEPKSGNVRLVRVPTPGSRPYGIVVDRAGMVWFNEFGRNALGQIDPQTMQLTEHPLPQGARGRRIALGADGAIWYVDYGRGFLARFDPATRTTTEWQTPGGARSLPYGMAVDHRGRMWFVESGPQPNRLIGFDPRTQQFFSTTNIPSGGGTVRHMVFEPKARAIWFGTDANTIGRARVPD